MPATVIVLAAAPDCPVALELPSAATVIAADGGADHAKSLGLDVDLLVGDLDSVSPQALAGIEHVERHPAAKDATDLELALEAALRLEPERILVMGSSSGRIDHLLASVLLFASDKYAAVRLDAQLGETAVHVIRGDRALAGHIGELISLFAVHGPANGVTTEGLVYPLRGETLEPGSSRGVSNVFADAQARITVEQGVVLAVRASGSATVGSSD